MNYNSVINELFEYIPEFGQSNEFMEVSENIGLAYVVFGSLQNYYVNAFNQGKVDTVKKISDFLEKMANSEDSKVVELLSFGFLENFDANNEQYQRLIDFFHPMTKKILMEQVVT